MNNPHRLICKGSNRNIIFLYFFLTATFSHALNVDSLKLQSQQHLNDSSYVKVLNLIASAYAGKNQNDSALAYAYRAISYTKQFVAASPKEELHNPQGVIYLFMKRAEASAEGQIGKIKSAQGDYVAANEHLLIQLKIGQEHGFKYEMAAALESLGVVFSLKRAYTIALDHFSKALHLYQEINDRERVAICYYSIGETFESKGDFLKAIEHAAQGLKLAEELKDEKLVGRFLHLFGNIFFDHMDYSLALQYYYKALHVVEKTGDDLWLAGLYNNIGIVNSEIGDYTHAFENHFKALRIYRAGADAYNLAVSLGNIGDVYHEMKDYNHALDFHTQALEIDRREKFNALAALEYNNIAEVYCDQGNYGKGKDFFNKGLKDYLELKDSAGIARSMIGMADLLFRTKDYMNAEKIGVEGWAIASKVKDLHSLITINKLLSDIYSKMGRIPLAFNYYKKYIATRDTVSLRENTKKIVGYTANAEYEKKRVVEEAEKEKDTIIYQKKIQKKNRLAYWGAALLILMVIFYFILFSRFRLSKQQKLRIEAQTDELAAKNVNVERDILSAKNLQNIILRDETTLNEFFPRNFILNLPKEVVTGDFHWAHRTGELTFIALADCVGHGVPGALMSVLGYSLLNDIVVHKGILDPAKILDELNLEVIKSLHQAGNNIENTEGGMDISICCVDNGKKQIQIACAHQPVFIAGKDKLQYVQGDIFSIGFQKPGLVNSFKTHTINLEPETCIYFSSDGFQDQFGGKKGRKFSSDRFEKILSEIFRYDVVEQKRLLYKNFLEWKNDQPQTDDVLIMAVKI